MVSEHCTCRPIKGSKRQDRGISTKYELKDGSYSFDNIFPIEKSELSQNALFRGIL
jgi:hypothetical protein